MYLMNGNLMFSMYCLLQIKRKSLMNKCVEKNTNYYIVLVESRVNRPLAALYPPPSPLY